MKTQEEKLKRRKERKRKIREVKKELKEEFKFNAPNIITLLRLALTFIIVYMIFSGFSRLFIAIVFAIAAFSDFIDGYVARKFNKVSNMGARLDQVIDRIFTVTIILALIIWFFMNSIDKNFLIMLFLVSSREIIGLPGVLIRIIRNKDAYKVKYIGKITTFVQSSTLFLIIIGFSFSIYFSILTCAIGILSGFDYLKDSIS